MTHSLSFSPSCLPLSRIYDCSIVFLVQLPVQNVYLMYTPTPAKVSKSHFMVNKIKQNNKYNSPHALLRFVSIMTFYQLAQVDCFWQLFQLLSFLLQRKKLNMITQPFFVRYSSFSSPNITVNRHQHRIYLQQRKEREEHSFTSFTHSQCQCLFQ